MLSLVQVRLRAEVPRTPSSAWAGLELMTSSSWQYISCHWEACYNHLAISDCPYMPTQTPKEDQSGHMQSPRQQHTVCMTWCLIWWLASFEKYGHRLSLIRPGVIKQHKPRSALKANIVWTSVWRALFVSIYRFDSRHNISVWKDGDLGIHNLVSG